MGCVQGILYYVESSRDRPGLVCVETFSLSQRLGRHEAFNNHLGLRPITIEHGRGDHQPFGKQARNRPGIMENVGILTNLHTTNIEQMLKFGLY